MKFGKFPVVVLLSILIFTATLNGSCLLAPLENGPAHKTESKVRKTEETPSAKRIKIVATIFPLADIVRQIGKEIVEVTALLPPGASPHTFEPTVEQARSIAETDMLVFIGGGLDDWATKLAAAGEALVVLEMMKHLGNGNLGHGTWPRINTPGQERDTYHSFPEWKHPGYSISPDPHIWLDPLLVKDLIAPFIAAELKSVCPKKSVFIDGNLASFQQELEILHEEIAALTASFSGKRFISYHSAWGYFADRYGLEEVATLEEFPGKEPSAKWLSELISLADLHDIQVIFAEVQLGTKAAETIATEIGGEVLLLDPLGGESLPGREDYCRLMRYNAAIFQKALQ